MITSGALKVFQPLGCWGDRDKFLEFATHSNYEAAMWSGKIYVLAEVGGTKQWVETPFVWSDFELEIVPSHIALVKDDA